MGAIVRSVFRLLDSFLQNMSNWLGLFAYRRKVGCIGATEFPIKKDGRSFVGRTFSTSDGAIYAVGAVDEPCDPNLTYSGLRSPMGTSLYQAVEILPQAPAKLSDSSITKMSAWKLPIMRVRTTRGARITIGDRDLSLDNLPLKRFVYLSGKHGEALQLTGAEVGSDLLIGKPIESSPPPSLRREVQAPHAASDLVVIFVDGLSAAFFEDVPFEKVMPRTYSFFRKGLYFSNFRTAGEWTLPSIASIFTGLETIEHGLWHPRVSGELPLKVSILSELLQQAGFLTSMHGGNWRISPLYGYVRGFDRTLYKREASIDWLIAHFVDFHQAFHERNHFTWISAGEIHAPWPSRVPPLPVQVNSPNSYAVSPNYLSGSKSVDWKRDQAKQSAYTSALQDLDRRLGNLFNYLESLAEKRNVSVALVSDHGQSYLSDDPSVLSDARTRVPFIVRSPRFKPEIVDSPCQSSDVLGVLLNAVNLRNYSSAFPDNVIGNLEELLDRPFALSETIFPGKKYGCKVSDRRNWFEFESLEDVTDHGFDEIAALQLVGSGSGDLVGGYDQEQMRLKLLERIEKKRML